MLTLSSSANTTQVAVIGAGPAGLLAAILLLRQNLDPTLERRFQVTLVDPGQDYGRLGDEGLKNSRSWVVGLSAHGINALKEVPGLFEKYIAPKAVRITGARVINDGKTVANVSSDLDAYDFAIDRNFVCHALAKYLDQHFGVDTKNGGWLVTKYFTRAMFIDRDRKCVITRKIQGAEGEDESEDLGLSALPYDLVLGCDGVRSIVRNAFSNYHRDFEMKMEGVYTIGKVLHLKRPACLEPGKLNIIVNSLPDFTSFVLPGGDEIIDFGFLIKVDKVIPDALKSNEPSIVEEYARENLKGVDDLDCEEFAKQWVQTEFAPLTQIRCNFYHSTKLSAAMLGDAAHATVPNIGQGMNTALADAATLSRILRAHDGDKNFDKVLVEYSKERVKEGNALVDLSFHSISLCPYMQSGIMVRQTIRCLLNKIFPEWLVAPEPMMLLSRGTKLSEVYNRLIRLGYLQKSRRINEEIMRHYFERKVGMIHG